MFPIRGLYEVAIPVKDLARSETFYRNNLGLTVGLRDESRRWLFLRIGGDAGMVVLQENNGNWQPLHFAFRVDVDDLNSAIVQLGENGINAEGPVIHKWMPAKTIYFLDPDGHELELCSPVND